MAQTLKKILLVDDDDDLREALGEQLVMTEDFDVFEAGNGAESMEKIKEAAGDERRHLVGRQQIGHGVTVGPSRVFRRAGRHRRRRAEQGAEHLEP